MWVVQLQARCSGIRSDLSPLAAHAAALRVESALSVALLDLCARVTVEAVKVELVEMVESAMDADRDPQACVRRVHVGALASDQVADEAR